MPGRDSTGAGEIHSHFEYFVLRIVQGSGSGQALQGTAERLGSQQKVEFRNADELLHLLEERLSRALDAPQTSAREQGRHADDGGHG